MPEEQEDRIRALEKQVQELKGAVATEATPVLGLAIFVAVVAFIFLMAKLPLAGEAGFGPRFIIGLLSGIAGSLLFTIALATVRFGLKALAELLFGALLLVNISVGALLWASMREAERFLVDSGIQRSLLDAGLSFAEEPRLAVVLVAAVALFLFDLAAFLVIYPLSRTAGTDLSLD